jgi:nucleoside-diphosphate-sugar epimerase
MTGDAVVFGGSGQIGVSLLRRLHDAGWQVVAVSRSAQPESPGVRWLRGDLDHVDDLPRRVDTIISCGPLDQFAHWYAANTIAAPRVIAFGSTSVDVKQDSTDFHERDLARRLREGERALFDAAAAHGAAATLLRPTLVYGAGRDRTLTRIAQLARRWGRFALPRDACGLRQPVHVDDLAAAAHACIGSVASHGHAYALPGAETLPYREMVARVLAALQPPVPLMLLPSSLFSAALLGVRLLGRGDGLGDAMVARMRDDLVFDATPARRDFGYAPRAFQPTASMFSPD